jgi:hypothetical protein
MSVGFIACFHNETDRSLQVGRFMKIKAVNKLQTLEISRHFLSTSLLQYASLKMCASKCDCVHTPHPKTNCLFHK